VAAGWDAEGGAPVTASALTRPVPRPLPGAMPEPRTPGAVWHAWESTYTLQRGGHVLTTVCIDHDRVRTTGAVYPLAIWRYVIDDVSALQSWIARGGR